MGPVTRFVSILILTVGGGMGWTSTGAHGGSRAPDLSTDLTEGSCVLMTGRLERPYGDNLHGITKPIVYENGILFTCDAGPKDEVAISGSFVHWNKHLKMSRNAHGIWYAFLPLEIPSGTYPYRYLINGLWVDDPQQPMQVADAYGSVMSALKLPMSLVQMKVSPRSMGGNRFLFFLKDRGYKKVAWVGSRNRWDPYTDPMTLENGYWQITLSLLPGQGLYRFKADGVDMLDPQNPNKGELKFGEAVSVVPGYVAKAAEKKVEGGK